MTHSSAIWLSNRRSLGDRPEGLTVSVSSDGQQCENVWTADKIQSEWTITLPPSTPAKYVRI